MLFLPKCAPYADAISDESVGRLNNKIYLKNSLNAFHVEPFYTNLSSHVDMISKAFFLLFASKALDSSGSSSSQEERIELKFCNKNCRQIGL